MYEHWSFLYNCLLLYVGDFISFVLRGPFSLTCLLSSIEVLISLGFLLAR